MVPEQARDTISSVFESWGRPLLRYAICYTRNRAVAEEIVQEAFLALHNKVASGTPVDNPRAWTLTVVRHLVSKHKRDHSRETTGLADWSRFPETTSDIEAHLNALEALRDALDVLSEREEQVLLLRMESLRYDEIAKELEITPGTVATLLSRATLKIRRLRENKRETVNSRESASREGRRLLERRPLQ